MPVGLFHTFNGPVIGRVGKQTREKVTVFAPARLSMPTPSNVLFTPIAFVEDSVELRYSAMIGTSPVPGLILIGYINYFHEFAKGSYTMAPVSMKAGMDLERPAEEAMVQQVPPPAEYAEPEETPVNGVEHTG